MEVSAVEQPEDLRGNLDMTLFLLLEGRQVDVGEKESLHITHLTEERSKHSQSGQMPNSIHFHFLDTVQPHHTQDLHNIFHGC